MGELCWHDAGFTIDGISFAVDPMASLLDTVANGQPPEPRVDTSGATVVYKPRWMIDAYANLPAAARIVELGILRGGSTAFLATLFRPEKLVAVDVLEAPLSPMLETFIAAHDLAETVRTFFGVDQADRPRVEQIVSDEFDGPLDLVVDDASHLYGPTVASFNLLFPLLRPGGLYVIEDWSWEYAVEAQSDGKSRNATTAALARGELEGESMSRLAFELLLAAAYGTRVVAELSLRAGWLLVTRGPGPLDWSFDVRAPAGKLARTVLGRDEARSVDG